MSWNPSGRKLQYAKQDDQSASREERLARLKVELREHIRFLSDHQLFSLDWFKMTESLHQIANVAFMETHLPPLSSVSNSGSSTDDNPLHQQGKKEEGTLWDQHKDELAIRIILEEGKLNLLLRLLVNFKQTQQQQQGEKWDTLVKTASGKVNMEVSTINDKCRVFEQSLGILLRLALAHAEALQILDLPLFISHITSTIETASKQQTSSSSSSSSSDDSKQSSSSDFEKQQESLVLVYLGLLAQKMESLDEDRVMDLVEEKKLVPLLVNHLLTQSGRYRAESLSAALMFLNAVFNSESYSGEKEKFVANEEEKKKLVALRSTLLKDFTTSAAVSSPSTASSSSLTNILKKRDIQHLLDESYKYEKQVGPQ